MECLRGILQRELYVFFSKQELVQLIKHYIRGETSGGRNGTGTCSPSRRSASST